MDEQDGEQGEGGAQLKTLQMFDEKIYWTIVAYINEQGWTFGKVTHLGDNIFEFDIIEHEGFLAGRGGTYVFKVEEGKAKLIEKKSLWMS